MKTTVKKANAGIEVAIWQLFAILIAAIACLFAIAPLVSRYRSNKCDTIYRKNAFESPSSNLEVLPDYHKRYVRDVDLRDQCNVIPLMCIATATTTIATTTSSNTARSTVSTVLITRPIITPFSTTPRTTTPDPWVNSSRPYNSWRLPSFAKPIDYTLRIACPDCFTFVSNLSTITFTGQVTIRTDIFNTTEFLVIHGKNLDITDAKIISGNGSIATITYLPEFEMIYLFFGPSTITIGEITLLIDYTGQINQQDRIGFYREVFQTSTGGSSYLLATNFQPIHARRAFPCFDEPNMQATFSLTLDHPQNSTIALSNTGITFQSNSTTIFEQTQVLSTYSLTWAILPFNEYTSATQDFGNTSVRIWMRSRSNTNLNQTFEIIGRTLEFVQDYLNISSGNFPTKLDLIGIPDLILEAKASSSWGLLTFREDLLTTDSSLNSAERLQTTTKIIVEHILQIWFSNTDWWDNAWFDKSLSSFLAYQMIEKYYPSYKLMEQFPLQEMIPLMIDDFKPNIWPISNKNLTTNEQILDSLASNIYSKGASLLRLVEYLVGNETFQTAVQNILSINDSTNVLNTFYSNFDPILNTTTTVEEFLRSWLEEKNYPLVTIDFASGNATNPNTTLVFRQTRYTGLFELNQNSIWKIYIECDLGGLHDGENWNLTANYAPSRIKFILESSIYTIPLINEDYLWIKCNKDFYSYQVTDYISDSDDRYSLWRSLEFLFNEDIFSNNDKANLLNDAFILPFGGEIVTYDQTLNLLRQMFRDPVGNFVPWSVFVWHWNYLTGIEEHSKYFWNFKLFTTREILAPFGFNIDNILTTETDHQERLLKSIFFQLLCRTQNPNALNKATELFRLIPSSYFSNSTGVTNIGADYLSTVIYYHIQNANDMDEWDYLWTNLTGNREITAQQRSTFLRALGAAKTIWRLKTLLENAFDPNTTLIQTQEFFDLIISISENPNGRDIVWNFYRQNYESFLTQFGQTNRLFNQLISNIVQSFENRYYYSQMINFINQYPSSSQIQQLALDQIVMNVEWLNNGMAESLDDAISAGD